jgi:PPOX class probable F420-dependent enzyme
MPKMTDARRDVFLAARRYGILSTIHHDGLPASVPVWYGWDGRAVSMFSHSSSPKVRNLRRDPRATLLVTNFPDEKEAWVRFQGDVALKPGGLDSAERELDRYYPPGDSRRAAIEEWRKTPGDWLILELVPKSIRSYSD